MGLAASMRNDKHYNLRIKVLASNEEKAMILLLIFVASSLLAR